MYKSLAILLLAALPMFAADVAGSNASFYEREALALKESHTNRLGNAAHAKPYALCAVDEAKSRLEELKEKKAEPKEIADAEKVLAVAKRALENAGSIAKVLPIVNPVPTALAVRDEAKPLVI